MPLFRGLPKHRRVSRGCWTCSRSDAELFRRSVAARMIEVQGQKFRRQLALDVTLVRKREGKATTTGNM